MAIWRATFVFVVFAFVSTVSARNFPSDQKTFFPCIPRNNAYDTPTELQTFVHASAPLAESPTSDAFEDSKTFIYGGIGGFAGLGGFIGGDGGLPLVGGIGKFGGIGGYVGLGDAGAPGGGLGGAGLPGGLGGNGLLPCT